MMFARPYAKCYEILNQKKPYKQEIEFVYGWARKPKRILDLGCGTAHYWKFYPKETELLGVEKSRDMIALSEYKHQILNEDIMRPLKGPRFNLVTALFDVVNYLPNQDWWKTLPLENDGYFIFDMWDKQKALKDGFRATTRKSGSLIRVITPVSQTDNAVKLKIDLFDGDVVSSEIHEMFLYDIEDIVELAGSDFDVVGIKKTESWQTWLKLKRK